jgi:type I restriction-modification system DNA methylase subunit
MATRKRTAHSTNSFNEAMHRIGHRFSLALAFDDFLTMSIAACSPNPATGVSHYEDEYLATIAKYKDSELRHEFPKAFGSLITEMEAKVGSSEGNDILGDFFEQHISNGRNGQFFTPFPVCTLMASIVGVDEATEDQKTLRILDPSCGSGRMLMASHMIKGTGHEYYGIDIDHICVKMAALNLFLNGMWHSEVMCANALSPKDFIISYRISLLPFGIFKIEEKENSPLWHMHQNSFEFYRESKKESGTDNSQLSLF